MTAEPEGGARRVQTTSLRLLRGGRGGSHAGGMPPDLNARVDMKALVTDVSEIKAKISQMPTTFRMQVWFAGVSMGLVAPIFAIARAIT
jgi:hypothetical protein